eukprot:Partr_v1_DN26594_c0_g1_i3_m3961 putative CRAL TRIO domain protein
MSTLAGSSEHKSIIAEAWHELKRAISPRPDRLADSSIDSSEDIEIDYKNSLLIELAYVCGKEDPDHLMMRFLTARNWDVSNAVKMLVKYLKWRTEFAVLDLMIAGESKLPRYMLENGACYFWKHDILNRPVMYCTSRLFYRNRCSFQETKNHIVYVMELISERMAELKQKKVLVVIDMRGWSLMANYDMYTSLFMIQCMQDYYPDTLGCALFIGVPYLFSSIWSLLKPFLSESVIEKVKYIDASDIAQFIALENIPQSLNADSKFAYKYQSDVTTNASTTQIDMATALNLGNKLIDLSQGGNNNEREELQNSIKEWWKTQEKLRNRTFYHSIFPEAKSQPSGAIQATSTA